MNSFTMEEGNDSFFGGRKGETCSMSDCTNTHQRHPNMSFFRFPKELSRAKEWLIICERPDLMRRVEIGDITINNYYVCESHFPNQILDYATRKILIKTAKPLSVAELKTLPAGKRVKLETTTKPRRRTEEYDAHIEQEFDDDEYILEDSRDDVKFEPSFVQIAKAEGNYHSELLEPLTIHDDDDDSYMDTMTRAPFCWTAEATRLLITLRGDRDADFEQGSVRKSQLWLDICNKMREVGYEFTPEKVSKKWHNITITYQKNAEKAAGNVNWEFFDDMHAVFHNKKLSDDNSVDYSDLEPKQNGMTKRKFAEVIIPERSHTPESDRPAIRESQRIKKKRVESTIEPCASVVESDESWWKNYFEQKLELERRRMEKEDERHKDRMNFQKMAIMLQERVEKIKVEAMNNLTNALLRLQESGKL